MGHYARPPFSVAVLVIPSTRLTGIWVWAASFYGKTFFWRGETYQFGDQGRIMPEQRPVSLLGQSLPQGRD